MSVQSAPDAPGKGRPVLADASTVALFEVGYQVDDMVQSLVRTNNIHSAHGLFWRDEVLVVPDYKSLRQDMLYNLHDANLAGHPGMSRIINLVRRDLWWPNMLNEAYVQTCATYQRDKSRQQSQIVPLQ